MLASYLEIPNTVMDDNLLYPFHNNLMLVKEDGHDTYQEHPEAVPLYDYDEAVQTEIAQADIEEYQRLIMAQKVIEKLKTTAVKGLVN